MKSRSENPQRTQRRWAKRGVALFGAALIAVGFLPLSSQATEISTQPSFLSKVGPVDQTDGFPSYYQDSNGLRLAHCADGSALCGGAESPLPDPTAPVSFPNNYPFESFYYLAQATVDLANGGRGKFVASVEASFNSADPEAGAQMTFARLRFVIDAPNAGTYTVTSPYGKDTFDVTSPGPRSIFETEDIGIASGIFTGALKGRINPFLEWDTGPITDAAGNEYIGDPNTNHAVKNSPFGTNFFEIDAPNVGGAGINSVSTNLFALTGKIDTNGGLDPGHPTYSRTTTDNGFVDVHAASDPNLSLKTALPGSTFTTMRGSADGNYVARLPFTGSAPPTSATVENLSDNPHVVTHPRVTDLVTITDATYDTDAQTLTVTAASSDQAVPPVLTAQGFGTLAAGTQTLSPAVPDGTTGGVPQSALSGTVTVGTTTFDNVAAPPETVVVTSAKGGNEVANVHNIGSAFAADPATADAGADQTVQQGQTVTLDGSLSINANTFSWAQTGGPAVTLANANTPVATFTAPATTGALTFKLTVGNDTGTSTDDVTINVASIVVPAANAGPDKTGVLVGDSVLLDGSQSTGGASFLWTQTAGPVVTLTNADTARATFTMPATSNPVVFQLKVTGPGGTSTDSVSVTATLDKPTITRAQYTASQAQWRIDGNVTILSNNTVNVYLGTSANGTFIGSAQADPVAGTFDVRVRPSGVSPGSSSTVFVQTSRGGTALSLITLQ